MYENCIKFASFLYRLFGILFYICPIRNNKSTKNMDKKELKALRDALPKAMKYERIKKKLNETIGREYSQGTIAHVLSGTRKNKEVLIAAYKVAKEHQEELNNAKEALNDAKDE